MARIFLHIGTNKTGSSAIQGFCYRHRRALAAAGLLYPRTGLGGVVDGTGMHINISRALGFAQGRPDPDRAAQAQRLRADLDAEIARSGCDQVLVSSEFFVLKRPMAPVAEFFDGHDLRILVYLRRHDLWWAALYSQALRSVPEPPWEPGFAGYFRRLTTRASQHLGYRDLVQAWAEVFGAGQVLVRPYEAAQNQPDLIADMLAAIGLPEAGRGLDGGEARVNPSLSARALYLLEALRRAEVASVERARLIAELAGGAVPARPERSADHPADHPAPADRRQCRGLRLAGARTGSAATTAGCFSTRSARRRCRRGCGGASAPRTSPTSSSPAAPERSGRRQHRRQQRGDRLGIAAGRQQPAVRRRRHRLALGADVEAHAPAGRWPASRGSRTRRSRARSRASASR